LGGFVAVWVAARYNTTWAVAGLVLLGWGWIIRMGLKIPYDLFSDIDTKVKRLLTVIYLVAALPQLALMLLGFFLYWENTRN
jgi:pimeloyl-ACP methyl ester carboxylesterase